MDDHLDKNEVCRFFGGTKPIDPATLYRGIADGRFPRPIKIGPKMSRWLRSECEQARQRMIEQRDAPKKDAREFLADIKA